MSSAFSIQVTDVPDREELVAEVWWGDSQVAELRTEGGPARIEIYARPEGPWDFELSDLLSILERARAELSGG
jgi:hypothetical protein